MNELSSKNFGLVIAYVLPGFVALWGVSYFSRTVAGWISNSADSSPMVAGFLYVTLASLAAGLTVSAVRWALIDTVHHATGVTPPWWDFRRLQGRVEGFLVLVEGHYRYYQFYANMFVATAFTYRIHLFSQGIAVWQAGWPTVWFVLLEGIFFAGSRDALRKYYARADGLLR